MKASQRTYLFCYPLPLYLSVCVNTLKCGNIFFNDLFGFWLEINPHLSLHFLFHYLLWVSQVLRYQNDLNAASCLRKVPYHASCHITNLTRTSEISLAIELFWSLIAKTKGNSCRNFTNTSATAQQGQFVLAPDQQTSRTGGLCPSDSILW